jgi:hypothetical protein
MEGLSATYVEYSVDIGGVTCANVSSGDDNIFFEDLAQSIALVAIRFEQEALKLMELDKKAKAAQVNTTAPPRPSY